MICSTHWAVIVQAGRVDEGAPFPVGSYPIAPFFPILIGVIEAPEEPAPAVLFEVEMADWVSTQLGVPCYPLKIPQGADEYPALTYTLVDGDSLLYLSGASGQAWRTYQFDCYGIDYLDAIDLDHRLRKAFQALVGPMGRVTVQEANRHRPSSFYTPAVDASDDGTFRFMSEYTIWYVEH